MTPGALVFRASFRAYAPLLVLLSIPAVFGMLFAFKDSDWVAAFAELVLALAFWFWLSRFRLVITPERVIYRSLFGRVRSIRRHEILSARLAARTRDTVRLMLVLQSSTGEELRINADVFSIEAIKCVRRLGLRREKRILLPMACLPARPCQLNAVADPRQRFGSYSVPRVRR